MTNTRHTRLAASLMAMVLAGEARGQAPQYFRIGPQPLATALRDFAEQSGAHIAAASSLTAGHAVSGVTGNLTAGEALDRLLRGSGLHADSVEGTYVLRPDDAPAPSVPPRNPDILVTGSRIRGAPSASPMIRIDRQQIIDSGQATIADAIRALPQNFGGGQNPGLALGTGTANPANGNGTSGSAIDLRGLGPDATLTLLNGHRIAYNGGNQGIDVSTIPLAALDRIEIVADGASALYGSDAVAGVANIILRRDMEGLSVSARGGVATDGGDRQQLYSAAGGHRWSSGGVILTYSHQQDSRIQSSQRAYTRYVPDPDSLLPEIRSDSVILSGHQNLAPSLTVSIDATFNRRISPFDLQGASLSQIVYRDRAYSVAPSLKSRIGAWSLEALGGYGGDDAKSITTISDNKTGAFQAMTANCLCNIVQSAELSAEGPLLRLPAGTLRLALGGGYRKTDLTSRDLVTGRASHADRKSVYGYGEVFAPLVGPDMAIPAIDRLSATGALRYEHYADLGGVTTPKLGLLYSPVQGVDLKASWGKSFKAPLLQDEYLQAYAYLYPLFAVGGSRFPATGTALLAIGSRGRLKPERATSWSVTADLRAPSAPAFHALASYFHVDYRDRVITPVSIQSALSSPLYSFFVTYQPSVADQQAVIARSSAGLINFSGQAYDPGRVVALIDNYVTNVASQRIQGVDVQADYRQALGRGEISLTAQASYLDSRQRNAPNAPWNGLAGTVFNPPHVRARAGFIWKNDRVTGSAFLNYMGPVTDISRTPSEKGGSMATVDLALRWRAVPGPRDTARLEIALAAQNIANERPPYLRNSAVYYVPYDSTNYSAIGRALSIEVSSQW
jgi:iron complex outermembrane recepter protein